MKKILILGGTGFIGTELIKHLNKEFKLTVFYSREIPKKLKTYDIKFIKGDVLNFNSLEKCFDKNIDIVINLIGQIIPDLKLFEKININGNENIIKLIKKYNIKKTILISSVLVYGESNKIVSKENTPKNPKTIYAKIKSQVEELYFKEKFNTIILRLGNVYGKQQVNALIPNLLNAYNENKAIKVPHKNKIRNFINVYDVAKAIKLIVKKENIKSKLYNIGNKELSITEIITLVEEKLKHNFKKEKTIVKDEDEILVNSELAKKELNFQPEISFEQGINQMIEYKINNNSEKLEDFYKDKNILVTGGCGSIGSEIVRQLLAFKPRMIKVFDQNENALFNLNHELNNHNNIRYLIGSIRDKDRLKKAIKNVNIVFHAAALKHVPLCEHNPNEAIMTNVIGTQNLIDVSREENIDNFISISTDKAVNPINTMGATKLLSEKLVLNGIMGGQNTKFSCVRFGNVINTNGSVIPTFEKQIKKGGPITITSEKMTRFFMSISQAVHLVLIAAKETRGNEIFIFKMPALKIIDLAEVLIEILAPKYNYLPENIKIEIIGIRPGEKLHEALITEEESFHAISTKDMFILKIGLQVLHKIQEGINSLPINPKEYCSDKINLLSKEEIKEMFLDNNII